MKDRYVRREEIHNALADTNHWIWGHEAFCELQSGISGALAIVGKPGSGKSVLAKTIWNELVLQDNQQAQDKTLISSWFYCRRKGEAFVAYSSLLKSILQEILAQRQFLFGYYKSVYRRRRISNLGRAWHESELEEVLRILAESQTKLFLVLDGLDEAEDDKSLNIIQSIIEKSESRMKVVGLSRPMDRLNRLFWTARQIVLQDENASDLRQIVAHGIKMLQCRMVGDGLDSDEAAAEPLTQEHSVLNSRATDVRYLLHESVEVGGFDEHRGRPHQASLVDLENTLTEKANGVILWVVLVLNSLLEYVEEECITTFEDLVRRVDYTPLELTTFYDDMVEVLKSRMSISALGKARAALMWINSANELKRFTLGELWDALAVYARAANRPDAGAPSQCSLTSNRTPIMSWNHFKSIIERLRGSFVEIHSHDGRISGESGVQLVHQTAKDFLKYSPTARPLAFTDDDCLTEIQMACVSYIQMILEPSLWPFNWHSRDAVVDWKDYLVGVASTLQEYRLLELCLLVVDDNLQLLENLQLQKEMVRNCFLPQARTSLPRYEQVALIRNWIYDFGEFEHHPLLSSGFGYLFSFCYLEWPSAGCSEYSVPCGHLRQGLCSIYVSQVHHARHSLYNPE